MKKGSIQVKITAIVGLILTISCLLLTANSLFSARTYYGNYAELLENGLVEYDPVLPEGTVPPAINPELSYQDAEQQFSNRSILAMAVIVGLALAVTYWAAGRVLRPLKELTRSVRTVDDRHLDERVNPRGAKGEVLELTESFNRMLDRLENAFLVQKTFASNAAHELKTPLAVIKSSLQVMKLDPNPGEEDYCDFIFQTEKSLERIIKTVEGLLALANLEQVALDSEVNLYQLAETAVQELSAKAEAGGILVSVQGDQDSQVKGNQNLLYRVFINLIENSIKYNRPGGSVVITVKRAEGAVSVKVEDTGIGIAEEVIPHIFEPFYRADPSRSQQIPGSGLGLAVVKLVLERHGGEIQVESVYGKGTVFTVTL